MKNHLMFSAARINCFATLEALSLPGIFCKGSGFGRLALVVAMGLIGVCGPEWPLAAVANPSPTAEPELAPNVEKFIVRTRSPENSEIPFYVRIPSGYYAQAQGPNKLHRVLFSCPYFNEDGFKNVTEDGGLLSLADERGWFVISPTFHQGKAEVHDRKRSYYYPEEFSGQAVLDALDQIRQKYPIATVGLLLHGFSGGAEFVHRFAIWAPERVAAVVVNSSSWFDGPTPGCKQVAWLVTIGESDPSYENTLSFVAKLKDAGASPLLRSYIAMTHERGAQVPKLDMEFLKFYDDLTRNKMAAQLPLGAAEPKAPLDQAAMPYVGDAQEWKYYKNTPDNVEDIPDDSRVYLPSAAVAQAWGSADAEAANQ
jgi:pimeloyl-ACP methyl ester carboxylesterase